MHLLRSRFPLGLLVLSGLALQIPTQAAIAQPAAPDGLSFEQILTPPWGGTPIGFTFLPDHRVLVITKTGNVGIAPVGASTVTHLLTIPGVSGGGIERGAMGIVVDPGWPARPYLYFYYTHWTDNAYVTMYTATGDLVDPGSANLVLGNPYLLLTDIPDLQIVHQAGTLEFGPHDGMLYVSTGDDSNPCLAQDLKSLGGKILRLDVSSMPGAGTGPPPKADLTPSDNPFAGPGENAKLVFAWGLRNPFRFRFDDVTGDLFVGDVGAMEFEELDVIPFADAGANLGWPVLEATMPWDGCAWCDSCDVANTFTDPDYAYPNPGNAAIIGGPLYRTVPGSPLSLPEFYDGSYFFFEHWAGAIRRLVEGPSGWELAAPVAGQPSAENWTEGMIWCSDLQAGPDGALYLMWAFGSGNDKGLWRLAPEATTGAAASPPRAGPTVVATPNPASSATGTTIRWELPRPARVTIRIHDASGRLVASLRGERRSSTASIRWDGRTDEGLPAPTGVYFFELSTPEGDRSTGRLSWIR